MAKQPALKPETIKKSAKKSVASMRNTRLAVHKELCKELTVDPKKISMMSALRDDTGAFMALMVVVDGFGMSFKDWDKATALWDLLHKTPLVRDLEVIGG
jgi:hypothetical protein